MDTFACVACIWSWVPLLVQGEGKSLTSSGNAVTSNLQMFLLLLPNCKFAAVMNLVFPGGRV